MSQNSRFDKRLLSEELRDMANWPNVDTTDWDNADKERFMKYESSISDYLMDKNIDEICEIYDIEKSLFYEVFKRCLEIHPVDGRIYGKRALISYTRIKKYTRIKELPRYPEAGKEGLAGAFTFLLGCHPKISDRIKELFFKKNKKELHENRIELDSIHKEFLKACREEGIPGNAYPFNTDEKGRRALSHFLKIELQKKENLRRGVTLRYGTKAGQKLGSGESAGFNDPLHPLQEGQIDGHRLDGIWTLNFPDRFWGFQIVPCADIWLICLKDRCSKSVLGYTISFSAQYSSFDIIRTLKASIQPWKPMELTIDGFRYPEKGGVPSMLLPEYQWAPFDLIVCDNAKAHLAERTRITLEKKLGCPINYGPVYNRDHQADIENLFRQFAINFQHYPNTTGSSYNDTIRPKHPDEVALHYKMTIFDLLEIIELSIAIYNSTPQDSLDSLTPIEVLERYAARPNVIIRKIREIDRNSLFWLDERKRVKVKGDLSGGRRPYINFDYAQYTSPGLASVQEMVGKYITISFDVTKDARSVMAFLESGAELGPLTAMGQWSRSYHTFEMRKKYHALTKQKKLDTQSTSDARKQYLDYLFNNIHKDKRAANEFAQYFYWQFKEFSEDGGEIKSKSNLPIDLESHNGVGGENKPEGLASEPEGSESEFISYVRKKARNFDETGN